MTTETNFHFFREREKVKEQKLKDFAKLLEADQRDRLVKDKLDCQANLDNTRVSIKAGKRYDKVDVGTSGKYMVELETGNIYGIKAYGQIHKGHHYGTLDTINDWYWGNHKAVKKNGTPKPDQDEIQATADYNNKD